MKIYLLGYMYSGKTTVGCSLARQLDYRFADLDQLFEERYHTSIPLFFNRYGEEASGFQPDIEQEQCFAHNTRPERCTADAHPQPKRCGYQRRDLE